MNDQAYINNIKKLIENFLTTCISNSNPQTIWELPKYQIRKCTIKYTKGFAKKQKQQQTYLENELKFLEGSLNNSQNLRSYNRYKLALDLIYNNISEGIRIRRGKLNCTNKANN